MSDTPKKRSRLTAHLITPIPVAILTAGSAHAVTANPDNFTAVIVASSQPALGNVLNNDVGNTMSVVGFTNASLGSVNVQSNGLVNYSLDSCVAPGATDSFAYAVTDTSDNTTSNALATISFVAPGVDDAFTTPANTPVSGDVSANDLPTGNTRPIFAFGTPTQGGSLTNTSPSGAFTYTPPTNFSGQDSFTYQVDNGFGSPCNNLTTVDITVLPRAVTDTAAIATGGNVSGNVLTNDIGTGLHVVGSTSPAHGVANVASDGSFLYSPNPGYSGPDSFTYTVQDADDDSATGTVNITVGAAAGPVTALPATSPVALGLLGTLMAWLGLRRRRRAD